MATKIYYDKPPGLKTNRYNVENHSFV